MANLFPKAYVGFYYQRKGQFYHCFVPAGKAGEQWEYLAKEECEIIDMVDLEEAGEIKYFLIRGAHYAEVWPKLAS
jgi:hypothetical protein